MLKLETVLCAGIFFGLIMVASLEIVELHHSIRIMDREVGAQHEELRKGLSKAYSLHDNAAFRRSLEGEMSNTFEMEKSKALKILPDPADNNDPAQNCRDHFNEYQDTFKTLITDEINQTLKELIRVWHASIVAREELRKLEDRAKLCSGKECAIISPDATKIKEKILDEIKGVLFPGPDGEYYTRLFPAKVLRKLAEKGRIMRAKVHDCVLVYEILDTLEKKSM